ncbi:hypothetical protein CDAR_279751 [Caerostris darwini]|uniref:Transmembrane protein n=1 Tax=Caerostris darwini TaxID=1538125 RepID=A0AAV4TPU0_9ARAC|nr:hypothetical protein CDAR_279751 [Caerostris darwini]
MKYFKTEECFYAWIGLGNSVISGFLGYLCLAVVKRKSKNNMMTKKIVKKNLCLNFETNTTNIVLAPPLKVNYCEERKKRMQANSQSLSSCGFICPSKSIGYFH